MIFELLIIFFLFWMHFTLLQIINVLQNSKSIFFYIKNWQKALFRGNIEGEMALLSQGSSVKESPEDKGASATCVRGSAKISWRVTLALYTGWTE